MSALPSGRVLGGAGRLLVAAVLAAGCRVACSAEDAVGPASPGIATQLRAEALLRLARAGELADAETDEAARLLTSDDPFVRGPAEWALATRVEAENRTQKPVWPRADAPEWFRRWTEVPAASLLEMDYVRQAVQQGIHRDPARLRQAADAALARARASLADAQASGGDAQTTARAEAALRKMDALRRALEETADLPECQRLWLAFREAGRIVLLAHPAAYAGDILFVTSYPGHSLQNITGACYPWTQKPGGDICIQAGPAPEASCRELLQGRLGPGHVHGIDLWWDGDRVVFGYARQPDWPPRFDTESGDFSFELRKDQPPTHLFEMRIDGDGLRQLTDDPHWSDFEPTYCATGEIVFASDRSARSSECGKFSADHTVVNLYGCQPDGSGIRQLNDNKDIDRYPHSLDDGRIAYTHWEYQERHFFEVHAAWSIRPDGTGADVLANQHLGVPFGLRDVRSVPGGALVAVAAGHHTLAYGPLVRVEPRRGANRVAGIASLTPQVVPQEGPAPKQTVAEGGVHDGGGLWQTPWALSPRHFLAAYTYGPTTAGKPSGLFAVYLLDAFGNKELIHRDRLLSCSCPMPLRPRAVPPVLPPMANPASPYATAYVSDVYRGLPGVPRGSVKGLRILQHVGWPLDVEVGAMRWIPGNAWEAHFGYWSWSPTRVIGTVPVAADGSAWFTVPAGTAVYFQAIDDREMEIRRMRSSVTFQAGEVRGCVGCHETEAEAAVASADHAAFPQGEPAAPQPPPWGAERLLDYESLVQPILDRHCTRCHGTEQPAGGIELSARRLPDGFLQSYRSMFGLAWGESSSVPLLTAIASNRAPGQLVAVSDRFSGASVSQPGQFGSARSRLVLAMADSNHRDEVQLTPDAWTTLVTWIDANAPYYGTFLRKRDFDGKLLPQPVRMAAP